MRSIVLIILIATWTHAAPRVSDPAVVDLTAGAVRLVWNSGTDSRPEADIFTNAAGTLAAPGVTKTPFSTFAGDSNAINLATAEGVQEIQITGLLADTLYYLRARSVSLVNGATAQSPLIPVRTGATPLLALAGSATPFANPVLSLARAPSSNSSSSLAQLLVVTTSGARSGTIALNGNPETWFIDLNGLVASATGTPLPLSPGIPLDAALYTGNSGVRRFTLYSPPSENLAEVRPPSLAPEPPLNAHILAPAPGWLLMEFAATAGEFYSVERSTSLVTEEWEEIQSATQADGDRFHYSTNDVPATKAFYRTRRVDVLAVP